MRARCAAERGRCARGTRQDAPRLCCGSIMQPLTVVRTEAVIEILSFVVGGVIVIWASVEETEIWGSTCVPLQAGEPCLPGQSCTQPNEPCPSQLEDPGAPPSWDEGRLEMVWETVRVGGLIFVIFAVRPPTRARRMLASRTARGFPSRPCCVRARLTRNARMRTVQAWSFANFGQQVKQRVGDRAWFTSHPDAFLKSSRANFVALVVLAALLLLVAIMCFTAQDSVRRHHSSNYRSIAGSLRSQHDSDDHGSAAVAVCVLVCRCSGSSISFSMTGCRAKSCATCGASGRARTAQFQRMPTP